MKRYAFLSTGAAVVAAGCAGHNVLPSTTAQIANDKSARPDAHLDPAKPLPSPAIIGEVRRFDGKHDPHSWMICDGRSLRIDEYPKLYAVLGHSGGHASKGHFRLPNSHHLGFVIAVAGVAPISPKVVQAVWARRPHPNYAIVGKPAAPTYH